MLDTFEACLKFCYSLAVEVLAVWVLPDSFEVREFFLAIVELGLDDFYRWRVLENYRGLQVLKRVDCCVFRYACWYSVDDWFENLVLENFDPNGAASVVSRWAIIVILGAARLYDSAVE